MMVLRRRVAAVCAAFLTVAVGPAAGCGGDVGPHSPGELLTAPAAFPSPPAIEELVRNAVRIRYGSTSATGTPTEVSGVVFVPRIDAPPGGWPVASIGHPTTGVDRGCAPSADPPLLATMPGVTSFLSEGFVVVVSDYQGLGGPGPHPYLDPKTAAFNVIDAVRAARHVVDGTSDRWVAYGFSQGGQASWAANEMSADYGTGLRLAGSVSLSPPSDLRPLVDAMERGSLSVDQIALLPLILKGVQAGHPELNLQDYLHGALALGIDVLLSCSTAGEQLKGLIAGHIAAADYRPVSTRAADQLREWLSEYSLPARRAPQPMLVSYGDADPIIPAGWTAAAIQQGCDLGDVIDARAVAGQGHVVDPGHDGVDWAVARLAGAAPIGACGRS